ncbi:MAG: hypothetical protein HY689_03555 [Chloroflexi bacterium]|nr:hypothetical protein [Chloroflexota bacterium]
MKRDPEKAYIGDQEIEPGTPFVETVWQAIKTKGWGVARVILNGREIASPDQAPETLSAGDVVQIEPYDRASALATLAPETEWKNRAEFHNERGRKVSTRRAALATVVSKVTPAATEFLQSSELLAALAKRMAAILRDMIAAGAPFTNITLDAITDQETSEWTEIVFSVGVRADFAEMMHWWRKIGARRVEINRQLPENERIIFARNVGVHLFSERLNRSRVRSN